MFRNVLVEYKETALTPNMIVTVMLTEMNGDFFHYFLCLQKVKRLNVKICFHGFDTDQLPRITSVSFPVKCFLRNPT